MNLKLSLIIVIVSLLVSVLIIVFGGVIYNSLIQRKVSDKMILTEENSKFWSQIPGQKNLSVKAELYLFDFLGRIEDERTVIRETGPWKFDLNVNYTDREYDESKTYVNFTAKHLLEKAEDQQRPEKIRTLNLGAIKLWHFLKNQPDSSIVLKNLYNLIMFLQHDYYYTYIQDITRLKIQTLENFEKFLFKNTSIGKETRSAMFNGTSVSFSVKGSQVFAKCLLKNELQYLIDVFAVSQADIQILSENFRDYAKNNVLEFEPVKFALKQWYDLSPNDGISAFEFNKTFNGLEIGKFSRDNGLFLNLTESLIGTMLDPNSEKSLFKKKVMDQIFLLGEDFIAKYFEIDAKSSKTIFQYLQFFFKKVLVKDNGTKGILFIAEKFSYKFRKLVQSIGFDVFITLVAQKAHGKYYKAHSCQESLKEKSDFSDSLISRICSTYDIKQYSNLRKIIEGFLYLDNVVLGLLNLSIEERIQVTDPKSKFNRDIEASIVEIHKEVLDTEYPGHYRLVNLIRIGGLEIFFLRFLNYTGFEDMRHLDNEKYHNFEEFTIFCKFKGFKSDLTEEELLQHLDFDGLFSVSQVQKTLIEYMDSASETPKRGILGKPFVSYIREIFIKYILHDIYDIDRSSEELFYGYESRLLKYQQEMSALQGGDRAVDPVISFIPIFEAPSDWSFYSGVDQTNKIKKFKSINSQDTDGKISLRRKYWDGDSISEYNFNPYPNEVSLLGTDGYSFSPSIHKSDSIQMYIRELQRSCSFQYYNIKKDYLNMFELYRMRMDDASIFIKSNLYNNLIPGFTNLSSIYDTPLFASKRYFKDSEYENQVDFRKISTNKTTDDIDDIDLFYDSFVDVEPFSGVTLRSAMKLMYSIHIKNDELFEFEKDKFIPLFYIMTSFNSTDTSISGDYLNVLVSNIAIGNFITYTGTTLLTLFFALCLLIIFKIQIGKKEGVREKGDLEEDLFFQQE